MRSFPRERRCALGLPSHTSFPLALNPRCLHPFARYVNPNKGGAVSDYGKEQTNVEWVDRLMGSGPFLQRSFAQQAGTLLVFAVCLTVLGAIWALFN
jgi:hypothetical protein